MADETLSFSIIARDQASGAFKETARSAGELAGKMDQAARMGRVLDESLRKEVRAGEELSKSFAVSARAAGILDDEQHMLRDGALEAEFALKRETQAAQKSGDAAVRAAAENRTLADSLRKVSDSSFFKPSGMGIAAALSPALIPLAGGIAAGIGAIGVSFGAAAVGAGLFGVAAKSVLAGAQTNLTKLQALELTLNKATTPAAKKSAQDAIAALKATWAPGYLSLLDQLDKFHQQWTKTSQTIAVPALSAWLPALTKGMPLLATAVKPVAAVFQLWGQMLRQNFADPAVMQHLQGMAAAFGRFSAGQLTLVGRAIADIAIGFFHLGKDLAGSGANFSAAGIWINNMGTGFLTWSKSAKARGEVQGFMHYLHEEGPVVRSILQSLGTILPGIFKGASTTGTLELQAIAGFMGLIAKLPKGWQAPLTEAAGAMLLLSKTGVAKVGLTVAGKLGGKFAGTALGKAVLGDAGAGALVLPVTLTVAALVGLNQIKDKTGGGTLLAPKAADLGYNGRWAKDITHWWDVVNNEVGDIQGRMRHSVLGQVDNLRHDIADVFDGVRHDVAHIWDMTWNNTIGRLQRGISDAVRFLDGYRHETASIFDSIRHDIASAWNTIWNNTVDRVRRGVADVVGWFQGLPRRVTGALFGLGHSLYAVARSALGELGSGFRSVAGSIIGWIKGFGRSIIDGLKGLFGIHSPSSVFHGIGENLMHGLLNGLKAGHGKVGSFLQNSVAGSLMGGVEGAFGASAATAQRYASSLLSMYGWSAGQMSALVPLWNQESGWSAYAVNPSSGAYGIPQSLGHGHPYNLGDYKNQVIWGLNYIRERYGSPAGAWAHEQAYNWYAGGTPSAAPGWAVVGERGPELVRFRGGEQVIPNGAAGGSTYHITVNVPVSASKRETGREIVAAIRSFEQGSGKSWRS